VFGLQRVCNCINFVQHRRRELHRLGLRQGLSRHGGAACHHLSQRAGSRRQRPLARRRHRHSIEDVGHATAMLAVDQARLITGSTISVDGGDHIMS
jgi:NAD(P)-dependent dehydrogenase (short-subunit alcohol dehydrogenase family)